MNIKSIYSQAQELDQAVAELKQQLDPAFEAKLLLVFASVSYDQQILNQKLAENFSGTTVVGCSTAGEIVSGHMLQNSLVAMAFNSQAIDDFQIQVLENIK